MLRRVFTKHQKARLYAIYSGHCAYCGAELDPSNFHGDHIIPFIAGGITSVSNGAPCCPRCNLKKGARHEQNETI